MAKLSRNDAIKIAESQSWDFLDTMSLDALMKLDVADLAAKHVKEQKLAFDLSRFEPGYWDEYFRAVYRSLTNAIVERQLRLAKMAELRADYDLVEWANAEINRTFERRPIEIRGRTLTPRPTSALPEKWRAALYGPLVAALHYAVFTTHVGETYRYLFKENRVLYPIEVDVTRVGFKIQQSVYSRMTDYQRGRANEAHERLTSIFTTLTDASHLDWARYRGWWTRKRRVYQRRADPRAWEARGGE